MRIAYINADYGVPVLGGKGGSVHVKEIVNAWARLGHEVTLYHSRLGHSGTPPDARLVPVTAEPVLGDQSRHLAPEKHDRHRKELGWIATAIAIERKVTTHHALMPFDMIYERYSLWSCAGSRLSRTLGIPCVLEVNAPLAIEARKFRDVADIDVAGEIEREAFGSAAHIVAVSNGVRDYIISSGLPRERVSVIENGVDVDAFNPETVPASIDGLDSGPIIGFVGGLKDWHGIPNLMHAFRQVLQYSPDAQLLIVGDGPKRGWIEGFVEGAGMDKQVHLTGWKPHEQLPALIARMDIAVAPYPAVDDFYFSPLKLFEYLAAGKPIVASRIGQIDDVVQHNQNGLLVEPGNSAQLALAVQHLIENKALRQTLSGAARKAAADRSWVSVAQSALALGIAALNKAA